MFDDIIKAAKEEPPKDIESSSIRISVLGVGGAGCNCVNRIYTSGIKSARTVAINTDGKHLNMIGAHKKILIGKTITRGLGAGGDTTIAKKCAEVDKDLLKREIGENELVFICAGMGGGTGGGAAPYVAKLAKEQGAIVVAMVTYPFALERVRLKKAQASLTELVDVCDTVVVIDNNRLASYAPNLPINKAFELADSITTRAVTGISDTIMFPSLINVDYADVQSIMQGGGLSMISLGSGNGHDKVTNAVKDTLEHPLLDVNYEGARGCLIHLEGGPDLTLGDAIKTGELLTESFDDTANIKMGARVNPAVQSGIRVTAIITGVKSSYILGKEESNDSDNGDLQYL
ncbi:cell division protein FtsZ [Candidatus Micrarchaeota archaeon]|nr:cell division protein FtsZ [Candidatus Micrarchaeota archaeon]